MALNFPNNPAAQTPTNTFSPTSSPDATTNGATYIWNGTAWTGSVDGAGSSIITSATFPSVAEPNDLMFNSDDGKLYIYYKDADSSQWVDTAPIVGNEGGGSGASVTINENPPTGPAAGDLWWDSSTDSATLFIWYEDADSSQWVEASPTGEDGVSRIVAGSNITISPSTGTGVVTINSTATGGGGDGGDIYNGASAWGNVDSAGTFLAGLNIASVTRTTTGKYDVVFTTPMPNADYAVTGAGAENNGAGIFVTENNTATGFTAVMMNNVASLVDFDFTFAVFSSNALPPKGGTGTDAWATVTAQGSNGVCVVPGSFNVASVTRNGSGTYDVVFTTPMPSAGYAVTTGSTSSTSGQSRTTDILQKTAAGFTARPKNGANYQDYDFDFQVNATNATLPQTVTQEQIEAAINNPGLSAWGNIAEDATINGGLNLASVVNTGTGTYTVTFQTPMPDTNYSVSGILYEDNNLTLRIIAQRTTGFDVALSNSSNNKGNMAFAFQVAATNALPPKGGTGTDSWASVNADGSTNGTFNCTISRTVAADGTVYPETAGFYYVTFNTPMPTAGYSVTTALTQATYGIDVIAREKVPQGFWIQVRGSANGTSQDYGFDFQVNATDAVLPQTVTQEMIDAAIYNPGASAWGSVESDGTLTGGLNATITKTGTGTYAVTFLTPMPNANYSVVGSGGTNDNILFVSYNHTATGFSFNLVNAGNNSGQDVPGSFVVFATNALPPKGGTGTDAWAAVNSSGVVESSFNCSVTKTDGGEYDVVFTTPMPTAGYAVSGASDNGSDGSVPRVFSYYNKSTTGFQIRIKDTTNSYGNEQFSFTVNATNAVLPDSFTEAQIQSVLDFIAVANPAGVARAWGYIDENGNLTSSLNCTCVKTGTSGERQITFQTPLSSANYNIVTGTSGTFSSATAFDSVTTYNLTATGFTIRSKKGSSFNDTVPCSFSVFSS